jgi:hypothetical protein
MEPLKLFLRILNKKVTKMLKTVSSVANALGALNYKGTWNASTNTPTLASGVGTQGDYYVVSVAGATDLDGITNWGIGDWAAFNGSVWQRVEGGADGNFVNLTASGTATITGLSSLNGGADVAGNLSVTGQSALGATIPSDAHATWSQYFVGEKGSVISEKLNAGGLFGMWLTDNVYIDNDTGSFAYLTDDEASAVRCEAGEIEFWSAPLGDAGDPLTLTQYAKFTTAGNLAFVSGKGIDFSATAGTGTSELFDDYEEGTWTPVPKDAGGDQPTSFFVLEGRYTKIGRIVTATAFMSINDAGSFGEFSTVENLPFTVANFGNSFSRYGASYSVNTATNVRADGGPYAFENSTVITVGGTTGGSTGQQLHMTIVYQAA